MPETTADQLEKILEHLDRMDRRDRLRMWAGFFRGIIGLIPIAVLLVSTWYCYVYGAQILEFVINQATSATVKNMGAAASGGQGISPDLLKMFTK